MRTFDRLVLAYFSGLAACSTVRSAHAEEASAPSPIDAAPTAAPTASPSSSSLPPPPDPFDAREERVRSLRLRAEELDAEAEVERARARLKNARRDGPSHDADAPKEFFRPGRVLLPNLGGISFATLSSGSSIALYSVGPISFSHSEDDTSGFTFVGFAPSLDVVVGKHLTLGGTMSVGYTRSSFTNDASGTKTTFESESTAVSAAPRIGIVERLGDDVWVWPRLAAHVGESWFTATGSPDGKTTAIGVDLDVPFVFPLSRWVFLQVAPFASYTHLSSTEDASTFAFGSYARIGLAL